MISCIVIEDQMPARKILQKYIHDIEDMELKAMFSNAVEALEYLQYNSVDLMFLDIHLPKLSGIDFLAVLQKPPQVILTTAFSEYALKGYELDVVDYLLKPFSFERFLKAVKKLERQIGQCANYEVNKNPKNILVKVGYDLVKVGLDEIKYIQADGDYTTIYCINKKLHTSRLLKHWVDTLPKESFIQVHRSFVVNVREIEKISPNSITISNSKIPLGRVYKKVFREIYLRVHE